MAGPPHADASQVEAKIYVLSILYTSSILRDGWTWCNINAEDTYPRKCRIRHFLGFTVFCGKSRRGTFLVHRKTRRDRMTAKLKEVKGQLRRQMHRPIPEQGNWLKQVVIGFFAYHAVPTNFRALLEFRAQIKGLWLRTLRRRSQKDQTTWERITKLADDFLPQPRILHPWPNRRFAVTHSRWPPYVYVASAFMWPPVSAATSSAAKRILNAT